MNIRLSLILPCYNEEPIFAESARTIYETLRKSHVPFEMIFVDDGSSDKTVRLAKRFCKEHPNCRFYVHTVNQGRGAAVTTGMYRAKGTIVGYMDIDCEVAPVYIVDILPLFQTTTVDMVIGRRMYRSALGSFGRELLSVGYRKLVTIILHTRGFDTESGYKFFRRKTVLPLLPFIRNAHWFWDTEIVVTALRHNLRIMEYPVLFMRNTGKQSSVNPVKDTLTYIREIIRFMIRKE